MASIKEQRAKLQERISALQAREKALAAKEKEKERKARTKRLIEIGAVVESVVGHPIEKEQLEKFKNWLAKRLEKPGQLPTAYALVGVEAGACSSALQR